MAATGNIAGSGLLNTTIERLIDVTPSSVDIVVSPRGRYLVLVGLTSVVSVAIVIDAHGNTHTLRVPADETLVIPLSVQTVVFTGTTAEKVAVGY